MKAPLDILVVGGINTDFLVRGKRLPAPGETLEGDEFFEGQGGKGANQAVGAARLGARVVMLAKVGNDRRGTEAIQSMQTEKVDTQFVLRDAKAPTGVAVIMVDANAEKKIFASPGANRRLTSADVRRFFAQGQIPRVVLMQFESPLATVTAAAKLAKAHGCLVVLDPAPAVVLPDDSLLRCVDFIRPNSTEAEALTGIRVNDARTARKAATALQKRGVKAVALQAGNEGDLLVWDEGEWMLKRIPVKAVDATGAGDAFAAGLAVGLAEGRSFAEAGMLGNAAAALATTKVGAQSALPTRKEVERLLRRE